MPDLDWDNFRSINGKKTEAFERLCCLLAEEEKPQNSVYFQAIGDPDSGIECYWKLKNDVVWGWQAKYYRETLGNSQWQGINKSVKRAINSHHKLEKYIVCIPQNLPDARTDTRKSALQKWQGYVEKWSQLAKDLKKNVNFELWDEHQIEKRILGSDNKGIIKYFFDKEFLDESWLKTQLSDRLAEAGERYTEDTNIEVPLSIYFDALGRTNVFYQAFQKYLHLIKENYPQFSKQDQEYLEGDFVTNLETHSDMLYDFLDTLSKLKPSQQIEWDGLLVNCKKCAQISYDCKYKLNKLLKDGTGDHRHIDELQYKITKYVYQIDGLSDYCNSKSARISNSDMAIVKGNAGTGKTHLLCDMAKKRIEIGNPTLLHFGFSFTDSNLWLQLIDQGGLNCDLEQFLGALEIAARLSGSRCIIFIDAINETRDSLIWKSWLPGILNRISKYPWLALVVSIRTSYVEYILPGNFTKNKNFEIIEHRGFEGIEEKAIQIYFKKYEIENPAIPFLYPEFSNPLFLKLFCKALFESKKHKIPDGLRGLSGIYNYYLKILNEQLSEKMDFDPKQNLVNFAIGKLIGLLESTNNKFIDRKIAIEYINKLLPREKWTETLYAGLLSEGLFIEFPTYVRKNQWEEVVTLSYERLTDYLLGKHLLDKYFNKSIPGECFEKDNSLYYLINDEMACSRNSGLIEIFSVIIPELCKHEFFEVAPHCENYHSIKEAFIDSLQWRNPECFMESTTGYLKSHILSDSGLRDRFFSILLQVAGDTHHPYNAEFLHKYLYDMSLANRDYYWTIYIYEEYHSNTSIIRSLLNWIDANKGSINYEKSIIENYGIELCWLLTTSDRILRDKVTKILVIFLENHLDIIGNLLERFKDVNDPYVLERILAVGYGCSMRSNDNYQLEKLAALVYEIFFEEKALPIHILMRDYARGIIEYAMHKSKRLKFPKDVINPPYGSSLELNASVMDGIEKFKDDKGYWGLWASIMYDYRNFPADFGKYIVNPACSDFVPENKELLDHNTNRIDTQFVQAWILKRVVAMGWKPELFDNFDRAIASPTRAAPFVERIGKKYQWIAFHEIMAKIADNCILKGVWSNQYSYEGPWQIHLRDIDPSFVLLKLQTQREQLQQNTWWFKPTYNNWFENDTDIQWLKTKSDLPNLSELIMVDHNNQTWLNLESIYEWEQLTPGYEKSYKISHRDIWYHIRSYIIRSNDLDKLHKCGRNIILLGERMLSSWQTHEVYLGELYWSNLSKAWKHEWEDGSDYNEDNKIPLKILVTSNSYSPSHSSYDQSINSGANIYVPDAYLIDNMELNWNGKEGKYYNSDGQLIALDPSVDDPGPSALLVRMDEFNKFLKNNDLSIFWTLVGFKEIIGGGHNREYLGRLELSGIYSIKREKIKGKLSSTFL